MAKKHFIIVGRTSPAIAQSITRKFGCFDDSNGGLLIDRPCNVFQSRFGTFGDGESIFELFVDGKLPDHPIEQILTESQKQEIEHNLRGSHVTIVHSISGDNTSSRANSVAHGIADLKEKYGVASVSLIAPQLPYMRNDREFSKTNKQGEEIKQRNAVACRRYAQYLKFVGTDHVVNFEPHSRDGVKIYKSTFGDDAVFINTGAFFAEDFKSSHSMFTADDRLAVCVGAPDGLNKPDDFGIHRAKSFAMTLFAGTAFATFSHSTPIEQIPCMFGIHKERKSEKVTKVVRFVGDVKGKHAVIVDDIFSSGDTTIKAAEAIKENGAIKVTAIATHAVLVNGGLQKMLGSPDIDELWMTDTIPSAFEKAEDYTNHPKLRIKTVAPLVVAEIQKNHDERFDCRWTYPHPRKNFVTSAPTLQAN